MKKLFFVFLVLAFLVPKYCSAAGEDIQESGVDSPKIPIEVSGDSVQFLNEEQIMEAQGNVVIKYKGVLVTCNQAKVYMIEKKVIAEGNVNMKYTEKIIKAQKVEYYFENQSGYATGLEGWSRPYHFGTTRASRISDQKYEIEKGFFTTCDLDEPHYQLKAKKIKFYPDEKVVAENAILYVGKLPVFYIPSHTYYFKSTRQWQISLAPGKNDEWGYYLLSAYKYHFSEYFEGDLRLDYRSKRGLAGGFDAFYNTKYIGRGLARFYYAQDTHRNEDQVNRHTQDRYRVQLRHRWDIDKNNTITSEVHKVKDDKVIKDFFYREEYEKDTQPASYFYYVNSQDDHFATLLVRPRLNESEQVNEKLPQAGLDLKEQKLANTSFYFKTDALYGNYDNKEPYGGVKESTSRFDFNNTLSYPFKVLNFLSVTPHTGFRADLYSRFKDDGANIRGIFSNGIKLSTQFFGYNPFSTNAFGLNINKIRHIVSPTVEYLYRSPSTINEDKIIVSDEIDKLNMENAFKIGLLNKFQTKRKQITQKEDVYVTEDLLRVFVGTEYWFRGGYEDDGRGKFKSIIGDVEIRPWSWISLISETRFSPKDGRFETASTDAAMHFFDRLSIVAGHRYERSVSSRIETEFFYKLTPKWNVRVLERFEMDNNHFVEQQYSIERDFHCWTAEVGFNVNGPYGKTVFLMFKLKAFPEMPFSFKEHVATNEKLLQR